MEQEFKYEDLYTVLDEEYDSYAADLMFFQNETNLIQSHIKKIKDKVDQHYTRLQLYIKNEFWDKYNVKKHSFLMTEDSPQKIVIFSQEEFKEINALYDEIGANDSDSIEQELEELFNDDFDFGAEIDESVNNTKKKIKFMLEHIKERLFECELNKKQCETLTKITFKYRNCIDKNNYLVSRKIESQENFDTVISELVDKLAEDEKYDYNPDDCELTTIKMKNSNIWKIIYYKTSDIDKVQTLWK